MSIWFSKSDFTPKSPAAVPAVASPPAPSPTTSTAAAAAPAPALLIPNTPRAGLRGSALAPATVVVQVGGDNPCLLFKLDRPPPYNGDFRDHEEEEEEKEKRGKEEEETSRWEDRELVIAGGTLLWEVDAAPPSPE